MWKEFKLAKISRWEKFWLFFCRTYKNSDGRTTVYYKHLWGRLYVVKEVPVYFNTEILKAMGACLRFDAFGKERELPVGEGRVITFKRYTDLRRGNYENQQSESDKGREGSN